jgi:heterodisulfide reductase subunit A-like polyferredoxin
MKKVLVLGGGIGGIEAAIHLRKAGFDVVLVSP